MLKQKLAFFYRRKRLFSEARFQGQKIFLPETPKGIVVPSPEINLQFSDSNIIVGKKQKSKVRFFLLVSQHRSAQGPSPKNLQLTLEVESEAKGTLGCRRYPLKNASRNKYSLEIKEFDPQQSYYLSLDYRFIDAPAFTRITAQLDNRIPHVVAEVQFFLSPCQGEFIQQFDVGSNIRDLEETLEEIGEIPGCEQGYEIVEFLSHPGATCSIILAKEKETGQKRILKILDVEWGMETLSSMTLEQQQRIRHENIFRFHIEGRILREIDHPYIVKAIEYFTLFQIRVIVLEFLPGQSLRQVIQENFDPKEQVYQADLDEVLLHFFQICHALEHLHLYAIYHRDLKPDNIQILADDKRAVLIDLGAAKTHDMYTIDNDYSLGTMFFMSPEYVKKQEYDSRTEVFGLGIILFLALTGRHPFLPEKEFFPFYSPKEKDKRTSERHMRKVRQLYQNWRENKPIPFPSKEKSFQKHCLTEIPQGLVDTLEILLALDKQKRVLNLDDLGRFAFCYLRQKNPGQSQLLSKFSHQEISLLGPNRQQLQQVSAVSKLVHIAKHQQQFYLVKLADPKIFSENVAEQEIFYIQFKQQYTLLSRLYDANLPKLRFSYFHPEATYLVMENTPGNSLGLLIEEYSQGQYQLGCDQKVFLMWFRQMVGLLATLDSFAQQESRQPKLSFIEGKTLALDVFHHNIEPYNLVLDQEGQGYLLGFGKAENSSPKNPSSNLFYLPPEYFNTQLKCSIKSDLFSLGVCLHLALTGYHPFLPETYPFLPLPKNKSQLQQLAKKYLESLEKEPVIQVSEENLQRLFKDTLELRVDKRAHPEESYKKIRELLREGEEFNFYREIKRIFTISRSEGVWHKISQLLTKGNPGE